MNYSKLIEILSHNPHHLAFPGSWVGHIPFAMWIIQEQNPEIFVELGTHSGNSYFAFCQSVKQSGQKTLCYAVDSWEGDKQAGFYDANIYESVCRINDAEYKEFSTLLKKKFDETVNDFEDQSIGILHIDGLHTYDAVLHDFETWKPKLSPGAIVLFHDIEARHDDFGVYKFWEELRCEYPLSFGFLHSWGLGVIQMPLEDENSPLEIFTDNDCKKQLRNLFTCQGQLVEAMYRELESNVEIQKIEKENENIKTHYHDTLNEKLIQQELLEKLQKEINILLSEKEDWLLKVKLLESELRTIKSSYETITNSATWRLTLPVRKIIDKLKSIL